MFHAWKEKMLIIAQLIMNMITYNNIVIFFFCLFICFFPDIS